MLYILVIVSIIVEVFTVINLSFNLWSIASIITTITFCLRPLGIHVKAKKLIIAEVITAFVTIMTSFVIYTFDLKVMLISILLRAVFIGIVYYDDTQLVYIQEEEEKEI